MCEKETVFEVNKTYKTRDGRDARVICVDAIGRTSQTIVALISHSGPCAQEVYFYYSDGRFNNSQPWTENELDLMPPMRTVWVNFNDRSAYWYTSEKRAKAEEDAERIATAIPVEIPA